MPKNCNLLDHAGSRELDADFRHALIEVEMNGQKSHALKSFNRSFTPLTNTHLLSIIEYETGDPPDITNLLPPPREGHNSFALGTVAGLEGGGIIYDP